MHFIPVDKIASLNDNIASYKAFKLTSIMQYIYIYGVMDVNINVLCAFNEAILSLASHCNWSHHLDLI